MKPLELVVSVFAGAVASYFADRWLPIIISKWRRYVIVAAAFLLTFIVVALVASPKARDTARAIIGDSDDRRCYFNSTITAPLGAATKKDAQSFPVPRVTAISWEPNNCIMVVQSYENNVLDTEMKGQRSGMIAIQDVSYTGIYEIKIFREGFETESSNIWIEVVVP